MILKEYQKHSFQKISSKKFNEQSEIISWPFSGLSLLQWDNLIHLIDNLILRLV